MSSATDRRYGTCREAVGGNEVEGKLYALECWETGKKRNNSPEYLNKNKNAGKIRGFFFLSLILYFCGFLHLDSRVPEIQITSTRLSISRAASPKSSYPASYPAAFLRSSPACASA